MNDTGPLRASGRTTEMLIKMAEYLHKNYNEDRLVVLTSHRHDYSHTLLHKLGGLLDLKRMDQNGYTCGKVKILVTNHDNLFTVTQGMRTVTVFTDHHNPAHPSREMYGRQSIHEWVDKVAEESEGITVGDRNKVRVTGHQMANRGYLRGDISLRYKELMPEVKLVNQYP